MSKIYESMMDLVGNTPLVEAKRLKEALNLKARLLLKLESYNPAGSAKDRVGLALIKDAEQKGLIGPGSVIIEPTSGNTGIGLAFVALLKGYQVILTMPDTMSVERRNILKAYGARIELSDGSLGMNGAIELANQLAKKIPGSYIPGQFDNKANCLAHYQTTGPEIYQDTDGKVDIFVATVGTGGTITGTGEYLKDQNPNIQVIGVEPASSNILSGGKAGSHKIQGIGAGFIPSILNTEIMDEVIAVSDQDAFDYSKMLTKYEGVLVGISSGAAIKAAIEVAKREENDGKMIVVLLPDGGDRYFSTPLFIGD